jgi:hypothetical protein
VREPNAASITLRAMVAVKPRISGKKFRAIASTPANRLSGQGSISMVRFWHSQSSARSLKTAGSEP